MMEGSVKQGRERCQGEGLGGKRARGRGTETLLTTTGAAVVRGSLASKEEETVTSGRPAVSTDDMIFFLGRLGT